MLRSEKVKVFFDESGKRKDRPNLMGGLAIPSLIYDNDVFEQYSLKLRNKEMELHWNKITGDSNYKQNVIDALTTLAKYHQMIKLNVINYDYSTLANRKEFQKDLIEEMIYTKFPERIVYGLLRGYGRNIDVKTHIYIEDATEYKGFELHELMKSQLNIQSLYRGENYVVESSKLVPKNEEIGVELTDLLLGVIRTILLNTPGDTKGTRVKNEVVIELLKNINFYSLINKFKYFEWTNARELTEINFDDYLQMFLSKHHTEWV